MQTRSSLRCFRINIFSSLDDGVLLILDKDSVFIDLSTCCFYCSDLKVKYF